MFLAYSLQHLCCVPNIGPGVYFLPASFNPALKLGRRRTGPAFIIKLMYGTLEFSKDPCQILSLQLLLISSQLSQRPLALRFDMASLHRGPGRLRN